MKGVYKVFGQPQQREKSRRNHQTRNRGGVQIDHMPDNKGGKFGDNYKGGEYVDYEEVK